jgi:hypothetical protein
VLTYDEIIAILNNEYNRMPDISEKAQAASFGNVRQMPGLYQYAFNFDIEHVKLLLTDVDKCLAELKTFCDRHYETRVKPEGMHTLPSSCFQDEMHRSKNIIRETRDDTAIGSLRFFQPRTRKDMVKLTIRDDMDLCMPLPRQNR